MQRFSPWIPRLAAFAAALVGLVNIASTLTPTIRWRGHLLLNFEPVEAMRLFHALALPAGTALLLVAPYLLGRRRRAWQIAIGLMLALGAFDLLKGLDVEETVVTWATAAALATGDAAFRVRHDPISLRSAIWRVPLRRDPDTPNGLTEFLVVQAIGLLRERGVAEISLNFATFARWMHSPDRGFERAFGKLVALANPFFQIESLYRFNAKFFPRWEPRYLVYEGPLGLPRASLAAAWAEGQLPKPSMRAGTRNSGALKRQTALTSR